MQEEEKKTHSDKPHHFNVVVGYFYILNYFIGSGFLSMPFIFYNVGIIASVATLSFLCIVGCITSLWVLEILCRSRALKKLQWESEGCMLLENEESSSGSVEENLYFISQTRKFEMTEFCNLFMGWGGKLIFVSLFPIYSCLTLWAFASVVATTWSTNIPINTSYVIRCYETDFTKRPFPLNEECIHLYRICVSIFGIIVVVLSLLELTEQKSIQIFFSVIRFVALLSIMLFSIYIITYDAVHSNESVPQATESLNSTVTGILTNFDFSWWIVSVPIMCYSLNVHMAIPSLTHHIYPKTYLKELIIVIFVTICIVYSVIGVLVSLAFRSLVNENLTLNWNYFTGAQNNIAVRVLSYFIIIFPSMDLISAYPLIVTTLSNNIYSAIMCRDTSEDTVTWEDRRKKYIFRIFFALSPLIGAMFVSNLVTVINIAGIFSFTTIFFVPTTCQFLSKYLCSKNYMNRMGNVIGSDSFNVGVAKFLKGSLKLQNMKIFLLSIEAKTPHSGWYSTNLVNIIIFLVAVLCFVLGVVNLTAIH